MNKFLTVFVLFAAAVCCSAQNLDEVETKKQVGLLLGNEKLFKDFCLKEHVLISEDIAKRVAQGSSMVFGEFFNAATDIGDEILNVEKQAVSEFAKQIASPSQQVDDGPLSENEVQGIVDKAKADIAAQSNVFGRLAVAAKAAVGQVLLNAAESALFVRLAQARSKLNGTNLFKQFVATCNQVSKYEKIIEEDFLEAKEELKAKNTEGEIQKFIESFNLRSLKCHTVKYILRVNAFCELFETASGPFMKLLGIQADFKLPQPDQ